MDYRCERVGEAQREAKAAALWFPPETTLNAQGIFYLLLTIYQSAPTQYKWGKLSLYTWTKIIFIY